MDIQFESFDKNSVYNEQIQPLIEDVQSICNEHNIPCLMSFCISHDSESKSGKLVVAVTANVRENPNDSLFLELGEIISTFPERNKLKAFAQRIILADLLADIISSDDCEENKEAEKEAENEAE